MYLCDGSDKDGSDKVMAVLKIPPHTALLNIKHTKIWSQSFLYKQQLAAKIFDKRDINITHINI